jgi:hypothetical protein
VRYGSLDSGASLPPDPAMTPPQPPVAIIEKARLICLDLPDVVEEAAWTGTRWCIRKKNFAHVVMIDGGWPPAYAAAAGDDGPVCVLTFRTQGPAADTPRFARSPFFLPPWWRDIAGIKVHVDSDWDQIEPLLVASYCALAPKALAARVIAERG